MENEIGISKSPLLRTGSTFARWSVPQLEKVTWKPADISQNLPICWTFPPSLSSPRISNLIPLPSLSSHTTEHSSTKSPPTSCINIPNVSITTKALISTPFTLQRKSAARPPSESMKTRWPSVHTCKPSSTSFATMPPSPPKPNLESRSLRKCPT